MATASGTMTAGQVVHVTSVSVIQTDPSVFESPFPGPTNVANTSAASQGSKVYVLHNC